MMRSLYSGVAGLRTHQTKMDVLGNNIANVNTTSFKSQSITFSDLMYQTTQAASGATETKGGVNARQIGLGAKSGAIGTAIESQGATQTTNNPFDIMITGKAFFVVNNGKENLYTRDGSFYVDGAGNLAMQSNGYFVMGWNAIEDPDTGEITVNKNGELSNLQIMSAENSTYSPASTTSALVSGNIDDKDPNVVSDDGKTITLEFYDNKGYLYTGKFNIKDTGEDHLFSCELTEIIDSKGNKLTAAQMEGVSFGNQQESKGYVDFGEGYYLETSNSVDENSKVELGTLYQQSGQVAFKGVPTSGDSITTLTDIPDFLEKVYNINSTKRWSNINSFTNTGETLTVDFDYTDFSSSIVNDEYKSFVLDNTDSYFYIGNPEASNYLSAYAAPKTTGVGKLSDLSTEMLKDVFGMDKDSTTDTDASRVLAATNISNYGYIFDGDVLTIVATQVPGDTNGDYEDASVLKNKYDKYFLNADGSDSSISDIVDASQGVYKEMTTYIYDDESGTLELYGGNRELTDKTASPVVPQDSRLFKYLKERAIDISIDSNSGKIIDSSTDVTDANEALTAVVAKLKAQSKLTEGNTIDGLSFKYNVDSDNNVSFTLTVTEGTEKAEFLLTQGADNEAYDKLYDYLYSKEFSLKYNDLPKALQRELKTIVGNDKMNDDETSPDQDLPSLTFRIEQLTGTPGPIVNVSYKEASWVPTDEPIATFNRYSTGEKYKASDTYDYGVPDVVFRDSATKKKGFVLFDERPEGFSLDEIPEHILKEIYKEDYNSIRTRNMGKYEGFVDDFTQPEIQVSDFNVKFIAGGKITITHNQVDNVDISEDYNSDPQEDGTMNYVTAHDVIVYPTDTTESKTFPLEGYISDVLATADSKTKGLLEKVFGITDADARAYGSEGYYVIDEDQGVKLYTSKADLSRANKTIQLVFDAATGNLTSANKNETTKKVDLVFDQSVPGLEAFGFQETPGSERTVGSIEIDFSTVTNYNTNGSSTIKVVKGDKSSLNTGRAVGEMNGVTISTDGTIYATYSNGQTKLLGQIASAEFANASGLAKEGDNLYASTLNSGEATIQDITTDGGYMNTGVLEMSNVDLSKEFTEMITTQRGFQANSRIITVSDTLLEELTNLKR